MDESKIRAEKRKKFTQENLDHWQKVAQLLFGDRVPNVQEWTSIPEMVRVLNLIGKNNLNHTFHPQGGGLDLQGSGLAKEHGCIELFLIGEDAPTIVKPQKLTFNSFSGYPEWSYFLLETQEIEPSGVYSSLHPDFISEELTEKSDGTYDYRSDEILPQGSRTVERVFSGSFAIFQKTSPYNGFRTHKFNAYNAVHNSMTPQKFRNFCDEFSKKVPSMVPVE